LSTPAQAGALRWSVGPHFGWAKTTSDGTNTALVGGATRFALAQRLGGELSVDWRTDDLESGDVRTIPVQVSGLLYVLPAVHLTAGMGWYHVDASFDAVKDRLLRFDDSTWDSGLHVGGGIEIPLGSRSSLTAEARYVFLGYRLEDAGEVLEVDADFFNVIAGLQLAIF
jgi:opacity protein-like surface antigen